MDPAGLQPCPLPTSVPRLGAPLVRQSSEWGWLYQVWASGQRYLCANPDTLASQKRRCNSAFLATEKTFVESLTQPGVSMKVSYYKRNDFWLSIDLSRWHSHPGFWVKRIWPFIRFSHLQRRKYCPSLPPPPSPPGTGTERAVHNWQPLRRWAWEYFCVLVKSRHLQVFWGSIEHLRKVSNSLRKQPVSAQNWSWCSDVFNKKESEFMNEEWGTWCLKSFLQKTSREDLAVENSQKTWLTPTE